MTAQQPLEPTQEFSALRQAYRDDPKQQTFNLLLLGHSGSGKTFTMSTARKPVLIHSFDPGGAKGLRDFEAKGEIIVDPSFEKEDPLNPSVFAEWEKKMERYIKSDLFSSVGTYVLDSSTTWADAIMNSILKKAGIPGQPPRFTKDYTPQKVIIGNWISRLLSLPCDVVLTGHLQAEKDEISGKMMYRYMTTGKGVVQIPLMFDELWICVPKETSKGTEYRLLTQSSELYAARSRLSAGGKLEMYEPPNIKAILRKAGLDATDKPLLREEENA